MKLTKIKLQQIIKEELQMIINEVGYNPSNMHGYNRYGSPMPSNTFMHSVDDLGRFFDKEQMLKKKQEKEQIKHNRKKNRLDYETVQAFLDEADADILDPEKSTERGFEFATTDAFDALKKME